MAALTSIAVSARTPMTATITFNAAAIDCTAYQLKQLQSVVNKLVNECSGDSPTTATATVTGI